MSKKIKRILTCFLVLVMCSSAFCASAAWRVDGYDTQVSWVDGVPVLYMVYTEYDNNGYPTGRYAKGEYVYAGGLCIGETVDIVGLKPYAYVEFKNPWLDICYPNEEYAGVYVDDYFTDIYVKTGRNGVRDKVVEYKETDYMWELAAPYNIYSIVKAKLNIGGAMQWFGKPEYGYPLLYTGRRAEVTIRRYPYGFGVYEVAGENKLSLIEDKLLAYTNPAYDKYKGITSAELEPKYAEPETLFISEYDIVIPRTYDYVVCGPEFDKEGNSTPFSKTVAASKYKGDLNNFGINTLISTVRGRNGETAMCEITWADGGYESTYPHRVYKWLVVDGIVMDGSYIGNINGKDVWKPAIAAYTGAIG